MEELILTSWTDFKALAKTKQVGLQYLEWPTRYDIAINEGVFVWTITLSKDDGDDVIDFENNYKSNSNKSVSSIKPFADATGFRARFQGFNGTATAGQTTDVDFLIEEERYINGGTLFLYGHSVEDSFSYQVVDIDNVIGYGAGVVLDEFIKDWSVDSEMANQGTYEVQYPARIYAGLYVRIKYVSTGLSDIKIKLNLLLHKKT